MIIQNEMRFDGMYNRNPRILTFMKSHAKIFLLPHFKCTNAKQALLSLYKKIVLLSISLNLFFSKLSPTYVVRPFIVYK